jgi:hypothetical protein
MDDGKRAAATAAHEPVVKLNFHQDGGLSYGDEGEDDGAVVNEDNIAFYSAKRTKFVYEKSWINKKPAWMNHCRHFPPVNEVLFSIN